jgi:hypothetical protein
MRTPGVINTGEDEARHEASFRAAHEGAAEGTTRGTAVGATGTNQRMRSVAAPAPRTCAATKAGTSGGRIPAKVLVSDRATVTAGFAKQVDAVNQYADVM